MARRASPKSQGVVEGLRVEQEGPVLTFILARPERLNALTFEIYQALYDHFGALRSRPDVRAVILTGEGRGFCTGGDVEQIIGRLLERNRRELEAFTRLTCGVVARMRACPQPIVAALNGVVAGAGAALAVASDFRLAVPEARIGFLFVKAGLSAADMGASHLLPRLVGLGRATEWLMLGDFVSAEEALRTGLYHRVVAPKRLREEARAWAQRLAEGPSHGLAVSKKTLDRQLSGSLQAALVWDAKVQAECMMHPDFREAYEAFRDKRKPAFR